MDCVGEEKEETDHKNYKTFCYPFLNLTFRRLKGYPVSKSNTYYSIMISLNIMHLSNIQCGSFVLHGTFELLSITESKVSFFSST